MIPLVWVRDVKDFGNMICYSCLKSMSGVFNVMHYNIGIASKENTVNRKIYVEDIVPKKMHHNHCCIEL